jgi:hypothetical protein
MMTQVTGSTFHLMVRLFTNRSWPRTNPMVTDLAVVDLIELRITQESNLSGRRYIQRGYPHDGGQSLKLLFI